MVNKIQNEKVIDVVKDNAIWINAVKKEQKTAAAWEKTWGFYKEGTPKSETSLPKIENKFLVSPMPSKLPPGLTNDPNSLISAYLTTYNINLLKKYHYPTEKYVAPPTTQSEIGWTNASWLNDAKLIPYGQRRKSEPFPTTYSLDRFQYARGKRSIFKWWGGGPDSLKRMR